MNRREQKLPADLTGRLFTVAEANSHGLTYYRLEQMLANEQIERLGRGIYHSTSGDIPQEDWFRIATIWVGKPSAICLISALAYYNLTDEIARKTWIMVPHTKISRHKELRLNRVRNPKWDLGIEKKDGFWITSIPRTIVDAFIHSRVIGTRVGIEALKAAIEERATTIRAVYDLGLKLGIGDKLLPYVELLS